MVESRRAIGCRRAFSNRTGALRYVCLPGAAFTGSTLLGFLLNSHPACVSIGAATGLIPGIDIETYRCSCGVLWLECPFWKNIKDRTDELGYPVNVHSVGMWESHFQVTRMFYVDALLVRSLRNVMLTEARDAVTLRLPAIRQRMIAAASATWALAYAAVERTGASVFIDTSRDHLRPKALAKSPLLETYVVHLIKDARANTASIMKHTGLSAAKAARIWRRANLEAERNRRYVSADRWLTIRYNELCQDVQGTLDHIADFLNVPRAPVPADFRSEPHHIAGNAMRLRSAGEVKEDTSWSNRLTTKDLAVIARIAGSTNRRFGFAWPD